MKKRMTAGEQVSIGQPDVVPCPAGVSLDRTVSIVNPTLRNAGIARGIGMMMEMRYAICD